jgi:hypothetical protein
MKTLFLGTTALVAGALIPSINEAHAQNNGRVGRINLRIANVACSAVSPQTATGLNPNPSDINDGDLDDAEILALQEGCTLRAIATDRAGNRIAGEELTLLRAEAPAGTRFPFGYARTTDAQGVATWRFRPTPNTDFIYEAVSAGRSQPRVASKNVEIQLCTGQDSVDVVESAPTNDAGMGCQYLNNGGNGGIGDNEGDIIGINPVQ